MLLIAITLIATSVAELPEEEDVLVLGEANFNEALDLYPDILVEFYAPWCGHCKKLAPEYAKAAAKLKARDPPIRIAKVDATAHPNLAKQYGVQGYPTLKYFISKQPTDYTGGRTEDTIISWLQKRSGPAVTVISSLADLKKSLENNKVALVLFAQKEAPEFEVFEFVAKSGEGAEFLLSTDSAALTEFSVTEPKVVLFKQFDDKRNDFGGNFNTVELSQFFDANKNPWLLSMADGGLEFIFQKQNNGMLLFRAEADKDKLDATFSKFGKDLKGELAVAYADLNDANMKRVGEFLGVKPEKMPQVMISEPATQKKFLMTTDVTEANVNQFVQDWKNKKLEPYIKSEDIPAEPLDNGVRVLVAKNFESIVYDSTKDVLVEFYAPWCGHCKKLAPEYEELAKELKSVDTMVIAKIDSTANEVAGVNIRGFPTLKFYPANNKKGMDFEGDRTKDGLKDFVVKNASNKVELRDKTDL